MKDRLTGPRLGWQLRQLRHALGLPGVVGAGILLGVLLFYAAAVVPLVRASSVLDREIATLEARRQLHGTGERQRPADPARQLAEFYRFFPSTRQAPDDLAKLHSIAAAHQIRLEQGNYRLIRDKGGKLSMYEISLPVKGDYPQLRKFLSQALAEIPHLALDSVSFQRQKSGDTALESQIKFTLFLLEAS